MEKEKKKVDLKHNQSNLVSRNIRTLVVVQVIVQVTITVTKLLFIDKLCIVH